MIKASFEALQPVIGQSFLIRTFDRSAFDAPYHFHPEYELTCILKGEGKRYAGNNMGDFTAGDLVLLGPNLPHCWKLDPNTNLQPDASAIVIQFDGAFLGDAFFDKAEMRAIKKLLQKSTSGISFDLPVQEIVNPALIAMAAGKSNFGMLMSLLDVLQQLAVTERYALLDQNAMVAERTQAEQERINPVFAYLVENFRQHVSLETAAGIANMTPNAFCKYFKKITRKTFMETIIEYRLNYAAHQLVQTDKSISDIAFESGFGDVSHFYRMFKEKTQLSPLNYRKKFVGTLGATKKA